MAAQLSAPGPARAHPPVVKGHPFIASFQKQGSGIPGGLGGHIYRDSLGRSRIDYWLPEEVRFIDDITKNTLFVVYPTQRVYERDTYKPTFLGWTFSNVNPVFTEEHQQILGVDCVRVRFKVPRGNGDLGEAWISKDLGVVMKDMNPSEDWNWEVTKIDFREPEAGSFDVPVGFEELHQ